MEDLSAATPAGEDARAVARRRGHPEIAQLVERRVAAIEAAAIGRSARAAGASAPKPRL